MKAEFFILLVTVLTCSVAEHDDGKQMAEARGKAKYALLIHFFYVVATKLFVLKIVYGAIFYALVVKGWHFVTWFIHFLKKKDHQKYVEYHEPYHGHNEHDFGQHGPDYGQSGHDYRKYGQPGYDIGSESYGSDSYGPYAYEKQGYSGYKKAYDADGSFSIKS